MKRKEKNQLKIQIFTNRGSFAGRGKFRRGGRGGYNGNNRNNNQVKVKVQNISSVRKMDMLL